ncbi:MAG TPA: GIY-YIG nuclease family protein [Steroidobacteraceae bacterium]|jgi:hypothetical protein|nr:GIY-YIG nuclease family protein [Steroidobacteraceae bacterium]
MSHLLYVMSMQPILEADKLPLHKKVGITNNTVIRAAQLATKMPFTLYVEAAWEVGDGRAAQVEAALHKVLNGSNIEGEWFEDPDESLVDGLRQIMQLMGCSPVSDQALDQQDDSRGDLEERYARTELSIKQLLENIDPVALGWQPQPARAVDQRFVKNGATLYVQPNSHGATLSAYGKDNAVIAGLKQYFGERVNQAVYSNGQMRHSVTVTKAELKNFFSTGADKHSDTEAAIQVP